MNEQAYNDSVDYFLSYELDTETVTLHLNACICNETYKAILKYLSELCNKNRIFFFKRQ